MMGYLSRYSDGLCDERQVLDSWEGGNFSLPQYEQTGSDACPASLNVSRMCLPRGKKVGADHSPSYSVEDKNTLSCTSKLLLRLHSAVIRHRENLTCTLISTMLYPLAGNLPTNWMKLLQWTGKDEKEVAVGYFKLLSLNLSRRKTTTNSSQDRLCPGRYSNHVLFKY